MKLHIAILPPNKVALSLTFLIPPIILFPRGDKYIPVPKYKKPPATTPAANAFPTPSTTSWTTASKGIFFSPEVCG